MPLEFYILLTAWIVPLVAFFLFVPKAKVADAFVIFLFNQAITWIVGLLVVEKNWVEYPYRCFSYANSSSFTFEFYVYPAISIFFVLFFPFHKNKFLQAIYYIGYTSVLTINEVILEKYTTLIHYKSWNWYWSFITILFTLYAVNAYYHWFRKGMKQVSTNDD